MDKIAPKPLFRDPIFDSVADPMVIYNVSEGNWWMFYTQRRANFASRGVAGAYGCKIGVAVSDDGGNYWYYRGALDLEFEFGHNTFWAPEIVYHDGKYHMFVSYIRGIHHLWKGARSILHYTSSDLMEWKLEKPIDLGSKGVIDPCILRLADSSFRMWFKDESLKSYTIYADSTNLYDWELKGEAITDCAHEGPNVFEYNNKYYMITDCWDGLGVYSSNDLIEWKRQKNNILKEGGKGLMDGSRGSHADVVVNNGKAYIFYFTHYNRKVTEEYNPFDEEDLAPKFNITAVQVAQLEVDENGDIYCDRDKEISLDLK
jgi:hypothetical protein